MEQNTLVAQSLASTPLRPPLEPSVHHRRAMQSYKQNLHPRHRLGNAATSFLSSVAETQAGREQPMALLECLHGMVLIHCHLARLHSL